MFKIPTSVIQKTTTDDLAKERERSDSWRSDEVKILQSRLTDTVLEDLATAAEVAEDKSFGRMISAIQAARAGDFKSIPKMGAAPAMLIEFLSQDIIDGWLYLKELDGHFYPYLVSRIRIETSREDTDRLVISLEADAASGKNSRQGRSLHFEPSEVTRKKPSELLLSKGAYKETPELRAAYDVRLARFEEVVSDGFAKQYRFTGRAVTNDYRAKNQRTNSKVIHDLHPSEIAALRGVAPSELFKEDEESDGVGAVPISTTLPVFDLKAHDFITVNVADMTDYVYDKKLRDKIILPDDQRELLDILTTDIETFTNDVIEGKSAGNVILSKGKPGVGKTLTAEVYSEIIERPLYSIHSGNLGTTADVIRKNLEEVFDRAKRWNAVLLLDEADVFVLERGNNLQQNAIVAEFLRTMEYFDGLMFMTTNRADSIDDAIISRSAAIIDYLVPGKEDARKVWVVQASNNGVVIPDAVLNELMDGFVGISPRDIKMLLRLALRVSAHKGEPLSADLFARCAIFRGLHFGDEK